MVARSGEADHTMAAGRLSGSQIINNQNDQ